MNDKIIPVGIWHRLFVTFLGIMWVQNETTRSPIRAPEVVKRDVKRVEFFKTGEISCSR